jgi:hypothetical protein
VGEFKGLFENDGGGDAIDVVVAVDFYFFVLGESLAEAFHGAIHVFEEEGVVEVFEAGIEEVSGGGGGAVAAVPDDSGGGCGDVEFCCQGGDGLVVGLVGKDPAG